MSYTVTKTPRSLVFTGLLAVSEQLQMSYNELQNWLQTNDFSINERKTIGIFECFGKK